MAFDFRPILGRRELDAFLFLILPSQTSPTFISVKFDYVSQTVSAFISITPSPVSAAGEDSEIQEHAALMLADSGNLVAFRPLQ